MLSFIVYVAFTSHTNFNVLCCMTEFSVSSKLVEAEKNYRRAAKTAESYKIQVTKLNPTGATTKRKFSNVQVRPNGPKLTKVLDKDLQISLMEKELAALKEEVNNKKSKACIIS